MHADHYFTIGSNHQTQGGPCEDYAMSGTTTKGRLFAVVADGCSGAGEADAAGNITHANTDIGARAISWAFKKAADALLDNRGENATPSFHDILLGQLNRYRYDESTADYLATVVGLVASPTQATIFVQGDGAIAIKYKTGAIQLIEFCWWNNMPYYLAYQLNMAQNDMFEKMYQNGFIEPFCKKTSYLGTEGSAEIPHIERFSVAEVAQGFFLEFDPVANDIQAIAVLTDGIEQVGEQPSKDVVLELMSFKKSVKGSFVKRRMMRALQGFHKGGAVPKDDIAMAVVWFEEVENG